MARVPVCRTRGDGRALARGQPTERGRSRLAPPGRHVHRGRHLRLERRSRTDDGSDGRRPRRDPRSRHSASRWPGSRAGPTRTSGCSSTTSRARSSVVETGGQRHQGRRDQLRDPRPREGVGFATAATSSGPGSETSSMWGTPAPFSWRWSPTECLLPGMQQRLEKAMSGSACPATTRLALHPSASGRCRPGPDRPGAAPASGHPADRFAASACQPLTCGYLCDDAGLQLHDASDRPDRFVRSVYFPTDPVSNPVR